LARQILGILRSQIEIEHFFSSVSVFTSLQHCQLGFDNLDALVMIYKNWPDNAQTDYKVIEEGVVEFFLCKRQIT
jgi:hypothetical protein